MGITGNGLKLNPIKEREQEIYASCSRSFYWFHEMILMYQSAMLSPSK